jgi:hypothetical protein
MSKSLKKEQIELLRFEKQLLGLGTGLAALTAGAGAQAEEAVGSLVGDHAQQIQQAYLNLVESVQTAHEAIEASALNAGVTLLQAAGQPKEEPPVLVLARAILGLA